MMYTNNAAYSAHIDTLMRSRNSALAAARKADADEREANMAHRYGLISRAKLAELESKSARAAELADEADRAWESREESARSLGIID